MDNRKKDIAILGSTGSIGTQTLQVIEAYPNDFSVEVLTANNNVDLLISQALKFKPNAIVIANEAHYSKLQKALCNEDIKIYAGSKAIEQVVTMSSIDVVVTAMTGYSGLLPTVNAIKAGKTIALANKETLVVAGQLINKMVCDYKVSILPVDSEHSAIFQCLIGESSPIEKILLTASGGPFLNKTLDELANVKASDALKHPTWNMGAKVTIDSASLMNKGFEVMEARWLFGVDAKQIEVLVHPQSMVHSMVQFEDGNIKAQIGVHDMRLPIQYALTFPHRVLSKIERVDWTKYNNFTFLVPDTTKFRNLNIAYEVLAEGGNKPAILNAANEIAVAKFLKDEISFLGISDLIEETLSKVEYIKNPDLDDIIQTDKISRSVALDLINKVKNK